MNTQRYILYVLLVLVGAALGYVLPHASAPQTTPTAHVKEFDLTVKNGKIVTGSGDITVNQGDTVKLVVTNDADNELHLHGYNIMVDLKAGQPGTITFEATASGRFPFELEQTKQELGAVSVLPQ